MFDKSHILLLLAIAGLIVQQWRFSKAMEKARERERDLFNEFREREREITDDNRKREEQLLNRILRQVNVKAVGKVEVENVVKLPDPELPPPTYIDEAFRLDQIKEMIEMVMPEAAGMDPWEIQSQFPQVWKQFEAKHKEEHTPLRIE